MSHTKFPLFKYQLEVKQFVEIGEKSFGGSNMEK